MRSAPYAFVMKHLLVRHYAVPGNSRFTGPATLRVRTVCSYVHRLPHTHPTSSSFLVTACCH